MNCKPSGHKIPLKSTVSFLKDNNLSLLPADKKGDFVVAPKGMFLEKASDAIYATFSNRDDVSLSKVKQDARKISKRLGLDKLALSVEKCKGLSLKLFFSAKTHQVDCPLRVIASENGTWHKSVATFLQKSLNVRVIDDHFRVKNSEEIIDFLKDLPSRSLLACSMDIKDLYYSLPHDKLIASVEECIDRHGYVAFQNEAGLSMSKCLELLAFYLKSTFAT